MTTIGMDVRMIQNTGIGTYLRGLLRGLDRNSAFRNYEFRLFGNTAQANGFKISPFSSKIYSVNEQLYYPGLLKQCHLWHAPHYNIPFFKGRVKLVVTVHDLIHWIYRKDFFTPLQAFYAKTLFKRVSREADHIIAVSKRTKQDLINHFEADPGKVTVIYEGVENQFTQFASFDELEKTLRSFKVPSQYFLYVGSLKPHKNVMFLVDLFRGMKESGKIKSDLVVVGRKDSRYAPEHESLRNLRSGGGIHYIPEIPHQNLAHLYQGALALVHPSFYEGFGLTLLEAMASGTPVISSNAASLPEVAGDAAILFDPRNQGELFTALQQIEKDESLRRILRERGFSQLKKFSWEETARQTLAVYQKVLNS